MKQDSDYAELSNSTDEPDPPPSAEQEPVQNATVSDTKEMVADHKVCTCTVCRYHQTNIMTNLWVYPFWGNSNIKHQNHDQKEERNRKGLFGCHSTLNMYVYMYVQVYNGIRLYCTCVVMLTQNNHMYFFCLVVKCIYIYI